MSESKTAVLAAFHEELKRLSRWQVDRWNAQAGCQRWITVIDEDGQIRLKDLGVVLSQLPLGPTGRAVTLLESGSHVLGASGPSNPVDMTVIAWWENGEIYLGVLIPDGQPDPSSWNHGLEPFRRMALLGERLDRESFDRLVTALRNGIATSSSNRLWVALWCPTYDELLARLILAESVGQQGVPTQRVPYAPVERELFWLRSEMVLVEGSSSVFDNVDFRVVARMVDGVVKVCKVEKSSQLARADEMPLGFDDLPAELSPELCDRLRTNAQQLTISPGRGPSCFDVTWCGMAYPEIVDCLAHLACLEQLPPPPRTSGDFILSN